MIIISILIFIVSLLLMGIVLIQNSKGGGLASGFSSSNQIVGVQRTSDFLEKGTWMLATALLALCIVSTAFTGTTAVEAQTSDLDGIIENAALPAPSAGYDDSPAPLPNE
ncbi:MAG: preprotein translocase subunit SecG [Flavobacteriales bacterium]|nr:preprotein translocase subunit SecG [Flavobacteriales bacterium]